MPVQKLETVDAFVVSDFSDVPASGYVRRARKILQAGAWDMARSATYAFASFEIQRGGASAGINADDDAASHAVDGFRSELAAAASRDLRLLSGKGVRAPGAGDTSDVSLVSGVLTSARWAMGGDLEGRTVVIEESTAWPAPPSLQDQLEHEGATVVRPDGIDDKPWMVWGSDADLLLVGSKPGAMNHQGAEMVNAPAVVPWAPVPITTKALAVLAKRGITYVPDFVAAAGPLLDEGVSDLDRQVADILSDCARAAEGTDEPLFLACARHAESFLASWQPELPFGRPLAG